VVYEILFRHSQVVTTVIDLMGDRVSIWILGLLLCCMALSASGVYHLSADELRKKCANRELNSEGLVKTLRRMLVEFVKYNIIEPSGDVKRAQSIDQTNLQSNIDPHVSQNVGYYAYSSCGDS
jgi:hypothetical protein